MADFNIPRRAQTASPALTRFAGASLTELAGSEGPPSLPAPQRTAQVLLSVTEAAWVCGLERERIDGWIREGRLPVRRVELRGRWVPAVTLHDLETILGRDELGPHASVAGELRALRERVMQLHGELSVCEGSERHLQRYSDRLEARNTELESSLAKAQRMRAELVKRLEQVTSQLRLRNQD